MTMFKKLFAKLMSFGEKPKAESGEEKFRRIFGSQQSALANERKEIVKRRMAEKQKKPEKEEDLTKEPRKKTE